MSCHAGPDIVKNGLVFCYDMHNTQKSWRGKPTTNMLGNPTCLNNTGPTSVYYSGYEASVEIVSALNTQMYLISPYWIKYTKNSNSNGRIWFLGVSGLTIDTDYTYSVYIYTDDSRVTGFNLGSDNGAVSNTTNVLSSWSSSDINRVKRISATFRSLTGSQVQGCRISFSDPIGATFYMTGFQCEQQSIATPIVSGTRSNTQAIIDLTNNNTIPATNLTYNSDGSFSFDGTLTNNIYQTTIPTSYATVSNSLSRSWEVVVKPTVSLTSAGVFGHKVGAGCSYFCNGGIYISGGKWSFNWYDNTNYLWLDSGITATPNSYYHIVGTYDAVDQKPRIYVNGILAATYSTSTNMNYANSIAEANIGWNSKNGGFDYFTGSILSARYYSGVALSAAEVKQHFNAHKINYLGTYKYPATSASAIKTLDPNVPDGNYWYKPIGYAGDPILCYTVFSVAPTGKGYVLVARGRESTDWWNTSGQNITALIATNINSNTPIAVAPNTFVDGLIGGNWNTMKMLVNRLNSNDSWYFQGTTSTSFSWAYFNQAPSSANASATQYLGLFKQGSINMNWGVGTQWTDTLNYGGGNNCDRTFTWTWVSHGGYQGWSGGSACVPAGSFQNGSEGHAIQLVNCFIEC